MPVSNFFIFTRDIRERSDNRLAYNGTYAYHYDNEGNITSKVGQRA